MTSFRFLSPTRTAAFAGLLLAGVLASAAAWGDPMSGEEYGSQATKPKSLSSRASELAMQAMGLLGIRYKKGGNTPENGLDCSGLVRYVFKEAWGKILPRTSEELSRMGDHVAKQDLQPGDLVFYNTLRRGFSHVGIYLGDSKFIHAPSSGGQVRIESMEVGYWKSRFNGARRISEPDQQTSPLQSALQPQFSLQPATQSSSQQLLLPSF